MAMNVGGLASGLQTNDMITQLMQIERQPILGWEFKQKVAIAKADIFKDVASRMSTLKGLAKDLTTASTFSAVKTSTTDANYVTAIAASGSTAGSYAINVEQLARAHVVASKQFGDSTSALGFSGTFTLNGESITIDAADSLTAIRNKINATDDVGAVASIVDNTLRIKRSTEGATELTFVDDGVTGVLKSLEVLDGANLIKNEITQAKDSIIVVDGQTVTRSTNTISDAVLGLTLSLKAENPVPATAVTITVATDTDSIFTKIKAFIDSYNSSLDFMNSKANEKKVAKPKTEGDRLVGLLAGNSLLRSVTTGLRNDLGYAVSGLPTSSNNLSKIGISQPVVTSGVSADGVAGKLVVNETELRAAIENDLEGVTDLFMANVNADPFESSTAGIAVRVLERTTGLVGSSGRITTMESSYRTENTRLQKNIDYFESRLIGKERELVRKFAAMETALSSFQTQSQWLTQQLSRLPGAG